MPDAPDMELVRQYARHDDDVAFAELMQRRVNGVYFVALRHVAGGWLGPNLMRKRPVGVGGV